MVPSARLELALQKGTDFKSVVSTNFTTRASSISIVISLFIYNSSVTVKAIKDNLKSVFNNGELKNIQNLRNTTISSYVKVTYQIKYEKKINYQVC